MSDALLKVQAFKGSWEFRSDDKSWEENILDMVNEALDVTNQTKSFRLLNELLFCRSKPSVNDAINALVDQNSHHLCGYIFKNGDLAFNCRTCQIDSTCVLCQSCFDNSDHTGHEVTFHRTGAGGCCDCGDEEAWDPTGFCSKHGETTEAPTLDPQVVAQVKLMVTHILHTLVKTLDQVFGSFSTGESAKDILMSLKLSRGKVPVGNVNVVLNNDDVNSGNHVVESLQKTKHITGLAEGSKLQEMMNLIHHAGRSPIYTARFTSVEELQDLLNGNIKKICSILHQSNLLSCVSFDCQLVLERRVVQGVKWLTELCKMSHGMTQCIVQALSVNPMTIDVSNAELFISQWCARTTSWPQRMESNFSFPIIRAILAYDSLIPKPLIMACQSLFLSLLVDLDFKHYLGTQFVMVNNRLSSAYCGGLGTRRESSLQLSVHLLTVPSLLKMLEDDYKQGSFAYDVFVEFFDSLKYFFWSCCKTDKYEGSKVYTSELDLLRSHGLEQKRYIPLISNVQYVFRMSKLALVDDSMVRFKSLVGVLSCLQRMDKHKRHQGRAHVDQENHSWLTAFNVSLFLKGVERPGSLKAGFDCAVLLSQQIKRDPTADLADAMFIRVAHVLFSSAFRWQIGENVAIVSLENQLGRICACISNEGLCRVHHVGGVSTESADNLRYPLKQIPYIDGTLGTVSVVDSDVFIGDPVSHHIPVHRFFASCMLNFGLVLCSREGSEKIDLENVFKMLSTRIDMLQLIEDVFRIFAANAQIHAKMWVRNGSSSECVVLNYKDVCSNFMYQSDLTFCQIAVIAMGDSHFLHALVHKFQLHSFFLGEKGAEEDTLLADELFKLIIHIVTEVPVASKQSTHALRREMIHVIASSRTPPAFSVIATAVRAAHIPYASAEECIAEDDDDDTAGVTNHEIERILRQVSIASNPELASVTYSLQPQIWREVDPFYKNVMKHRESAEEFISQQITNTNKDAESWPMTSPPPSPVLTIFSKARSFLVSKTLLEMMKVVLYRCIAVSTGRINCSTFCKTFSKDEQAKLAQQVSSSLLHTTMHLVTLVVHHCRTNQLEHPYLSVEGSVQACLVDLLVHLEAMHAGDQQHEKLAHVKWCNDELSRISPAARVVIENLRSELGMDKKRKAKKVSKKNTNKKNRGGEAQRLALERMRNAQADALKAFAFEEGDEDFDEVEDVPDDATDICVLCHEALSKNPYGHLGFARKSAWGNPVMLESNETCPPTILSISRKPAGWSASVENTSGSSSSAAMNWGMTDITNQDEDPESSDDEMEDDGATAFEAFANTFNVVHEDITNRIDGLIVGQSKQKNPQVVVRDSEAKVFVNFCSHAMHMDCLSGHLQSLSTSRASFLMLGNYPPNIQYHEFACPMCKHLSNIIIPSSPQLFLDAREELSWKETLNQFVTLDFQKFPMDKQSSSRWQLQMLDSLREIDQRKHRILQREVNSVPCITMELLRAGWETISFSASAREAAERRHEELDASQFQVMVDHVVQFKHQWAALFAHTSQCTKDFLLRESQIPNNNKERLSRVGSKISKYFLGSNSADEETVFVPMLHMLQNGYCSNNLCEILAPASTEQFRVSLDARLTDLPVGSALNQAMKSNLSSSGASIELRPTDVLVSRSSTIAIIERQTSNAGVLLQVADPVALHVACLCSVTARDYWAVTRLLALMAVVHAVVHRGVIKRGDYQKSQTYLQGLQKIDSAIDLQAAHAVLNIGLLRFLRCSVLVLNMALGGQMKPIPYSGDSEVDILWTHFLGLPPLQDVLADPDTLSLISKWKSCIPNFKSIPVPDLDITKVSLVPLPENFQQLLAQVVQFAVCPTTGKGIKNPGLCLRCGTVICAGQACCQRKGVGPGCLHAEACGGGSGAFLLVEKCVVVLVFREYSVDISAPYVDSHGETDDYLKRMRPLKFHPVAYENLSNICARNEICHKVVNILCSNYQRPFYRFNAF